MLHHHVHAAFVRDPADFGGPVVVVGIQHAFRAEVLGQHSFGGRGAGADDARAELFRDLNRRGPDAAGAADDERPVAFADARTFGEHVHCGAAGQRERGAGVEIHARRQTHQRARRHDHFLCETTVPLNAQNHTAMAE